MGTPAGQRPSGDWCGRQKAKRTVTVAATVAVTVAVGAAVAAFAAAVSICISAAMCEERSL